MAVRNVMIMSVTHIAVLFIGSSLHANTMDTKKENTIITTTQSNEVVDIEQVMLTGRLSNGSSVASTVTLRGNNLKSITVRLMDNNIKVPNRDITSIDGVQYNSVVLTESSLPQSHPDWRLTLIFAYGKPAVVMHEGKKEIQYNLAFYDFTARNYEGRSREIIHPDGTSELIHD